MRAGNHDEDQRNPAKVELEKKKITSLIVGGWVSFGKKNWQTFWAIWNFTSVFGPFGMVIKHFL